MQLTIDRSKWGTGKLLRSDNKMCCLGFMGVACGIPKRSLLDKPMPFKVTAKPKRYKRIWQRLRTRSNLAASPSTPCSIAEKLASANDSFMQPNREARIKWLFKEIGVDVVFVDKQ